MENKKIDITSTVLEKGLDSAKTFLGKLIMPAVEEVGLLFKDQVTFWKFKNQVTMLNKAKLYCEKNNISTKTISLKLLCPLLDYSGIEEDDLLQDKWAILLSNMVDSEQNIDNHVFPYILSQLSKNEFIFLEESFEEKQLRVELLSNELNEFLKEIPKLQKPINARLKIINDKINKRNKITNIYLDDEAYNLRKESIKIQTELNKINLTRNKLEKKIASPQNIEYRNLKGFELSNIVRLGLIKEENLVYANPQTLEIPLSRDDGYGEKIDYANVDLEIDVKSTTNYILTDLGELFFSACKEKKK